ncbi:FecR family protein [Bacteroides oleiciplenus]|uniref:FecR family protein n=1 Tax=Bacteroides oleiciplenus TaxID=626931 RepID=UPI0026DACC7C|nr:FecR family protein [Bacteroides oleiciplenus]
MMKEGINKLDEELMARFLMGECSEEELHKVNAWLNESDGNARELFKIEQIYHLGKNENFADEKEIERAEKQLFKRLKLEETKRHKVRRMNTWMRYAAMFIGIFLISGLSYHIYQSQSGTSSLVAVTARDEVKELMLPDGTKVWLNKHTTLKYPSEFSERGRNVYIEGEAYFEVKRNVEKPFIVRSEAMQVRVLGTVFNLKSDKASRSAVATLIKGEIEVKGNHEEGMIVLSPGQKAELNGMTRRLVVKQVDTGIENWHNNQFVFEKADIFTIARTLENSYGVKIILAPEMDVTKTYTGALKKKSTVEEVLNSVKNVIPIEYKIVGNSVFLSSKK